MRKRKMTDDEILDYYVEMDGYDPDTADALPETYELNENIMIGEDEAKKIVKETYKSINTFYGIYYPNGVSKVDFTALFMLAWSISMFVLAFILKGGLILLIGAFMALSLAVIVGYTQKQQLYFYKIASKTVTIYKWKHSNKMVIYLDKKNIFKYKNGKWKQFCDEEYELGSRLLFQKIIGKLTIKQKKNKFTIYGHKKNSYIKFEAGQFKEIGYIPLNAESMHRHTGSTQMLRPIEINTDWCVDIPKSFLDFCKEKGIEPLEENGRIRYV